MIDTTKLTEVVRFILESDDSFYNSPRCLIYSFKDIFTGDPQIKEDFIKALKTLSPFINNGNIQVKEIINILSFDEKNTVFLPVLKCIYVRHNCIGIVEYEQSIQTYYAGSHSDLGHRLRQHDYSLRSSIVSFKITPERELLYGEKIKLEWECINPVIISLYAGNQKMDVSGLSCIFVSALFDCYELYIEDLVGNILDQKKLQINYRKVSYCINCGQMIYDYRDRYCVRCGMKICYE